MPAVSVNGGTARLLAYNAQQPLAHGSHLFRLKVHPALMTDHNKRIRQ